MTSTADHRWTDRVRAFARKVCAPLGLAGLLVASPALFAQTPAYQLTQPDAVTGDHGTQSFSVPGVNCTNCRLPDANGATRVDDYREDVYERPTQSGSSANVYYPSLDIVSGQVGIDATYLYYRINLYGNDTAGKWLPYYYGFEINFDADTRGDLFVVVEDPSGKLGDGGAWGTSGVIAWWDNNNNHGGANPTTPNGPGAVVDGYENKAFDQGTNNAPGGVGGATAVRARVTGSAAAPVVEVAVRRDFLNALNGSAVSKAAFRPYAAKAGGTTSSNSLPLHDKYDRAAAGSPYPWLAQSGAPGSCPSTLAAENALTAAQRAALASGTNVSTAFANPCYPSGGNVVEMDNAGNLSDFGNAADLYFLISLSGRVFEDLNYGGGAGRSFAAAGGVGRPTARVELYDAAGGFVSFATTDASGNFSFASMSTSATYTLRVVNAGVTSSRAGAVAGLLPVQTFRTSGLAANVGVADLARVGGERPDLADAGNGAAGTTMNTSTGAFTAGITGQAQSIVTFSSGTQNATGLEFGFNFDTVVNVNNTGQGSLRQFITNANALGGEAALAQSGSRVNGVTGASAALPAGRETSIFMVTGGAAVAGLRAGLASQLTAGVAVFNVTSALPAFAGTNPTLTVIDGGTQTFNVGNNNAGTLGAAGTVGTAALALPAVQRPEVMLVDGGALAAGLDIDANDITVRGIAIYGFGSAAASNTNGNLLLRNARSGAVIEQNVIGTTASSFADPGAAARSGGDNIRSAGADNAIVRNNLIGYSAGNGIGLGNGSNGWQASSNEIRGNAIGNSARNGIEIDTSGNATISGNLIAAQSGAGIDSPAASAASTISNNTITGNGVGGVETAGVRVFGSASLVELNVINANYGAGVMVTSSASAITISRNSIFANGTITTAGATGSPNSGQIGIDLLAAADNQGAGTSPFVTLNDSGDGDAGANALLNYPLLQAASLSGGNLTLVGFARPGSAIELFIAAADASGFGEGQTYLVTLTEGTAADTDAGTGSYGPGAVNGVVQGSDTTNRFLFTVATPAGVVAGSLLSATATIAGATSEFSGLLTVTAASPASLTHVKTLQVLSDPYNGSTNPKAIPAAEVLYTLTIANTGSGVADSNTVVVTDPIPANTRLFVGDLSAGAGPVAFVQGSPSSSLTWTYGGLASAIDDLEFSNDGGATFTITPAAAADGYDATSPRLTHLRMRPKGVMAGSSGGSNPEFRLSFKVRVE